MTRFKRSESYNFKLHDLWYAVILLIAILCAGLLSGCKHEPLVPISGNGNNGNGNGNGIPCNPNLVYFDQQVLPILINNCATTGCHNAITQEDGVVLTSYDNVMNTGDIETSDPYDSDFWEMINESDPSERMPPATSPQLTYEEYTLISLWLAQGAQNLHCDDNLGPCDSTSVSFTGDIDPIIQSKCVNCHITSQPSNLNIVLTNYAGVSSAAASGQLLGAVTHDPLFQPMPKGGVQLNNCEIAMFRKWISDGALNN